MLDNTSVVRTKVDNQNNHHDLTVTITRAQLAEMGVESDHDVVATAHCCDCPRDSVNFMVVDPIEIDGKFVKPENGCYDCGRAKRFPYKKATADFLASVTAMLAQLKS